MRAVLDTNTVVSALLFQQGHLSWLRSAWQRRAFVPLLDRACARELLRVLAYPKFELTPDEIHVLLGTYLPYTETIDHAGTPAKRLPRCRDPDDQKFLALAAAGSADCLVTGDRALLELDGAVPFAIETPRAFRRRW